MKGNLQAIRDELDYLISVDALIENAKKAAMAQGGTMTIDDLSPTEANDILSARRLACEQRLKELGAVIPAPRPAYLNTPPPAVVRGGPSPELAQARSLLSDSTDECAAARRTNA